MVASQGYHLPSRILHSPTSSRSLEARHNRRDEEHNNEGSPASFEMHHIQSPAPSYFPSPGAPSVYHTPPQDISESMYGHHQTLHSLQAARYPAEHPPHKVSRNPIDSRVKMHQTPTSDFTPQNAASPQDYSNQQTQGVLLPSLMPAYDSFGDQRPSPLESPSYLKSGFDATPPISPGIGPATAKDDTLGKKKTKEKHPPPLFEPSLKLLFSLSTKRDALTLILPAALFSLAAGLVPPYMTFVLGDAFNIFARYQLALNEVMLEADLIHANDVLKHDMLYVAIKLIILGVVAVTTTTVALSIWLIHGERVSMRLRRAVYTGVVSKPMSWFDLGMGKRPGTAADEDAEVSEENESSGGLMIRFSRETDAARYAIVSEVGRITTCICTIIACLVVAFWHSYQLTLVILGTVPVIVAVTVVIEIMVTPLMIAEKNITAAAASRVERSTSSIATVKAFNAENYEIQGFFALAERGKAVYDRITLLWGFRAGFVQFLLLAMFVTGFWFGNWQVVTGRKSAGDVTIVFWASLLASSNMQMILPMLNLLDKGKVAMAALLETAYSPETETASSRPTSLTQAHTNSPPVADSKLSMQKHSFSQSSGELDKQQLQNLSSPPSAPILIPLQSEKRLLRGHVREASRSSKKSVGGVRQLRRIRLERFSGELALKNVTFHYPSRPAPAPPALNNVSLFLPARETTYIVGGSGSGKSTVGALLLNLYKPDSGSIEADEQGIEWLDDAWLRSQIGMVSQGASVVFEGTVHENVALGVVANGGKNGRKPQDVTRDEVIRACQAALLHEFVRDLPEGYDTVLSGERGASLSGGQRQRLAIARAYVRDPPVLIMDEATSALDLASRALVHEAIKAWRRNKTTIIITHDLSPITSDDFVYVMRDGRVVEEGYRKALEAHSEGRFRQLAHMQAQEPEDGSPEDSMDRDDDDIDAYYEGSETLQIPSLMVTPPMPSTAAFMARSNSGPSPGQLGDHLRELKQTRRLSQTFLEEQQMRRLSAASPVPSFKTAPVLRPSPPRSDSLPNVTPPPSSSSRTRMNRYSHSPSTGRRTPQHPAARASPRRASVLSFDAVERAGFASHAKRPRPDSRRANGPRDSWHQLKEVAVHNPTEAAQSSETSGAAQATVPQHTLSVFKIMQMALPEIPNKLGLVFGLFLCIGSGICTPFFSSLFSKLLSGLGKPGSIDLTRTALLLLLIALLNGLADWGKYSILQRVAMGWILKLQERCFSTVIQQDKAWFDDPDNSPINLISMLVKDAEDARNLIGYVVGNLLVIASMVIMGLTWAFVKGWQLTLVGLAMGPLFVLSAVAGSQILGKYERLNKAQREDCAKKFYQSVSNVKAIRSMSLEPVFLEKFDASNSTAYDGGKKSAFFTGFGTGIAYFTIYVAQAIMFFVGAVFMNKGWYTFQQVLGVFVLLIFTVTFSTQVIQNIPQVTKAKYAASDLFRLHKLSLETAESQGKMTFPVSGRILFDGVSFKYPTRPEAPVLEEVSFEILPGECVGIVGPSGSGKSTMAALLQRLYEPATGVIRIDGRPLPRVDVKNLREHVAVISQHPVLFDMSVEDNIRYGTTNENGQRDGAEMMMMTTSSSKAGSGSASAVTFEDVVRAAKAAHLHDFIMTLPEGYKTQLGENASLISGGQAQRLQIARALLQSEKRRILLGDEITSALDAENQEAVMRTIMDVKQDRTCVLITHKLSVMKMCDRLIVIEGGRVVQQGKYEDLIGQHGSPFALLAKAGEVEHT